jgi:hypothetical protein
MLTRRIAVQQSAVGMATLTQCSVLFVAKHSAPSHSGRFKTDLLYSTLFLQIPRTRSDVALHLSVWTLHENSILSTLG